jgi:hypothetical protein
MSSCTEKAMIWPLSYPYGHTSGNDVGTGSSLSGVPTKKSAKTSPHVLGSPNHGAENPCKATTSQLSDFFLQDLRDLSSFCDKCFRNGPVRIVQSGVAQTCGDWT